MPAPDRQSRPLLALACATALGAGYAPFAPGTVGSAFGVLIWLLLPDSAVIQAVVIVAMFIAGCLAAGVAERHFGRTDPRHVVIDEVMGMLLTLFMVPVGLTGALVGFLLFRAADVIKPYPANRFERLGGGVGVMADDAMAAVYANLALRVLLQLGQAVA
jgi:phosphatidylglycerophosphatase A